MFLKQLYGAAPEDNLYLMQPGPATEVELSKQELQIGSYDVEKLPDVSTLQLLWRAYDCWDACTWPLIILVLSYCLLTTYQ